MKNPITEMKNAFAKKKKRAHIASIVWSIIDIIVCAAIVIGILWFVYSLGEVWVVGYTYDGTGPCEYSDINLFVHMIDWLN